MERLKEIDILRAGAFIFVVIQHILGGYSRIEGLPASSFTFMKAMYVMAKPAVPIFLFISGVSLFYAYSRKFNWTSYYLKRVKFVFIPYIIWSAINIYKLGKMEQFNNFITQLAAGNAAYHLWYMGMVIRLFLIFPLILWLAMKVHRLGCRIRAIIFAGLILLYYVVAVNQGVVTDAAAKFVFGNPNELQIRIISISILFWYLYFLLGIGLALNYDYIRSRLLKYRIVIFISYGFLYLYAYFSEIGIIRAQRPLSILYMVLSIAFFYLISVMLIDKKRVYIGMKFIGDYSFAAYMAHVIVLNYTANKIMLELNTRNYLFVGVATLIITAVGTPVIIKFLSFLPFSEYLTGTKRSKII